MLMFMAVISMFRVQSWMMNRKMSGMKMRKTIITASEAMIITIWMKIRMNYEEEKNNPLPPGNNLEMIINNLSVSYTDTGKEGSPVIIFIHGFPFNKSMWNL